MKKLIFAMSLLSFLILLATPSSAHIFRLHADKTEYHPGEDIVITLEIKNTQSVKKEMEIDVSIVENNNRYPPDAWRYNITLKPGETKNITIYNETVTDFMVNGEYTISAQLIDNGFALYEDEFTFTITGLPEVMDITILLSNNSNFTPLKDVFVKGEKIYVGYNASTDNVSIDCTLIYPDGSSKNIEVPCSFVLEENGIYTITMNASKEGYRSVSKTAQFAVIESPYGQSTELVSREKYTYLFVLIGIIAIVVIISILIKLKKR